MFTYCVGLSQVVDMIGYQNQGFGTNEYKFEWVFVNEAFNERK